MGVSTVTATRIFSAGVDGSLTLDKFPHTALSKTYTADHITPDSAGTMTAMMTGINANSGIIGFGPETERNDFNDDDFDVKAAALSEPAKRFPSYETMDIADWADCEADKGIATSEVAMSHHHRH